MPAYNPLNLISDKQWIIVDIGSKYTKFGFTGESSPRCIIPTEAISGDTGKITKVFDYRDNDELRTNLVDFIPERSAFQTPSVHHQAARTRLAFLQPDDEHLVFEKRFAPVLFIRIELRYALMHTKEKRIVVVESLLCPTVFRDTLASVLFDHFEIFSLIFIPSHVAALYTLGISTGLVLDVGYQEAVLIPVYEGIPILKAWQALPLASKAVEIELKNKLRGKVKRIVGNNSEVLDHEKVLDEVVTEDIKVKGCFVTTLDRAMQLFEGVTPEPRPPGFTYNLEGDKVIDVDSSCRETSYEVLFERDGDQMSVSTMILDSILKCAIDMRKPLAENIVLIGGTTMAKGFKARIRQELLYLINQPPYSGKLHMKVFKFHVPTAKENYVSWLGGSICGATETIVRKSLTREVYLEMNKKISDWSSLSYRSDTAIQKASLQL